MSRKRSNHSQNRPSVFMNSGDRVPSIPSVDNWLYADTPFSALNSLSIPEPTAPTRRGHRPSRPLAVTSFEPDDYCKLSPPQLSPKIAGSFNTRGISNNLPLSPYQYGPSTLSSSPHSESMISPLDNQTDPTSVNMSRQTSFAGNSFCSNLQKLRLSSSMSRGASSIGHNSSSFNNNLASPMAREPCTLSTSFDSRQVLSHTGGAADDKKLTDAFNRRPPTLAGINEVDAPMQRANSTGSYGSTTSRLSRRSREQVASSTRTLAPKAGCTPLKTISPVAPMPPPTSHSMSRTQSSESQNGQVAIPRVPYTRHIPNKVKCGECSEHADGFKGEHELKRHILRAHRPTRKVFVCIDPTPGKTFLSDCEHCNTFKRYNAYYNAAAHLRRRHFNKKPQGERRKGKLTKEEKRGGKGGGTEPKMEILRLYMREFEIYADGNPLDDADMAYSTKTSIAASAKQSSEQSSDEIDTQPIDEVDRSVDIDDLMYGPIDATCSAPAASLNTSPSMHPVARGRINTLACVPSTSPKISPLISDYSHPSPNLIDGTTPPTLPHTESATTVTYHSSAEGSQHYDPPLFDSTSQSLVQFLELNFEDMFTFSQN
ncbi:MAG: hypothetical protein Q9217_004622 [Psora testacea]